MIYDYCLLVKKKQLVVLSSEIISFKNANLIFQIKNLVLESKI